MQFPPSGEFIDLMKHSTPFEDGVENGIIGDDSSWVHYNWPEDTKLLLPDLKLDVMCLSSSNVLQCVFECFATSTELYHQLPQRWIS